MTAGVIASVLLAGAIGAVARYGASRALGSRRFPWAVLTVNIVGSAIAGLMLAFAATGIGSDEAFLIVVTGFCGGLTTFSTMSVETIELVLDGHRRTAALTIAANLGLGIGAAAIAFAIGLAVITAASPL